MSSSEPEILISMIGPSSSIPELIKSIRHSFRDCEFDEVQKILTDRDKNTKMEIENLVRDRDRITKEVRLLERSHGLGELENSKLEQKCEELEEKITRLIEEERVSSHREKRAKERSDKVCDENAKMASEKNKIIFELNEKINELNNKNLESERLLGFLNEKFRCLDAKAAKMEKVIKDLQHEKLNASRTMDELRVAKWESDKAAESNKKRFEDLESKGEKDILGNGDAEENAVVKSPGVRSTCNSSENVPKKGSRNDDAANSVETSPGAQSGSDPPQVENNATDQENGSKGLQGSVAEEEASAPVSANRLQIVPAHTEEPLNVEQSNSDDDYVESEEELSVGDEETESEQQPTSRKRRAKHQPAKTPSKKQKTQSVAKHQPKRKKKVVDYTQIRVSMKVLVEAVSTLTEPQKEWVKQSGFGSFLDFKIKELPHKLGFKVVKALNPRNFRITLPGGKITIKEEDVAEVLGFPHSERHIDLTGKNPERADTWTDQFGLDKSKKFKVSAQMVLKELRSENQLTEEFKLNFMTILYNCLIESPSTAFVNKKMLNFKGSLDELSSYNWPRLVMDSLGDTKDAWEADPTSRMYTGPLLFLIILYVDRVNYKGQVTVQRSIPTWLNWTNATLREKSTVEIQQGFFGKGVISKGQWLLKAEKEKNVVQRLEAPNQPPFSILAPTEPEESIKERNTVEEGMMNNLERAAFNLMDDLIKYNGYMQSCDSMVPTNPRLNEIEKMVFDTVAKLYRRHPGTEEETFIIPAKQTTTEQQETPSHVNNMQSKLISLSKPKKLHPKKQ